MKLAVFRTILHENVGLLVYIFVLLVRRLHQPPLLTNVFATLLLAYSAPIALDSITVARIRRNCWLLGVT